MNIKGQKWLFLGDSITYGCGTTAEEKIFWNLLAKSEGCEALGYGISGSRIAPQHAPDPQNPDPHYLTRLEQMADTADGVVVFGGTNDYGHGDAAFGRVGDTEPDTFCGAMHNLLVQLIKKYPQAQLVVMTPLHRGYENRDYNEWGQRNVASLSQYVDAEIAVCRNLGVPVLDLYRVAGMNPHIEEVRVRYIPDALHPNDAGHEIIHARLREFLKSL